MNSQGGFQLSVLTSSDKTSSSPSSAIVFSTRRVKDMQVQDTAVEMRNRSAMQGQGECQMLSSPHILDMYSCTEMKLVVDCTSHRYPHMSESKHSILVGSSDMMQGKLE